MEPLRKDLSPIKMRNYGRILQDVVDYICQLEDEPTRRKLAIYVAQFMRKKNLVWNKDQESNIDRIKADIYKISDGKLTCDFPEFDEAFYAAIKKSSENKKNTPNNQQSSKKK